MAAGRPRRFTRRQLRQKVDEYFDSIEFTRIATTLEATGETTRKGKPVYHEVPVRNRNGEPIMVVDYAEPPTVGGLCRFLGVHRSTWALWCDRERFPEYAEIVEDVKGRLLAYLERELLTRDGRDVKGVIFNLQANYGMSEKHEVEFGSRAAAAVSAGSVPVSERAALLESLASELSDWETSSGAVAPPSTSSGAVAPPSPSGEGFGGADDV